MLTTPLLSFSALRLFLAGVSSGCCATWGGLAPHRSARFPLSFSRSFSLCFLDFFLDFLLLDRGGLLMTVEVTVSEEARGGGLGEDTEARCRYRSCRAPPGGNKGGDGSLQDELWSPGRSWVPQPSGVLGELELDASVGCWWEGTGGWEETGRWVGGPEVTPEGRDERLEAGLPSSSRRSNEEAEEEAAGPRLLRWEMRAFLGAKGSMKSKSGCRF